MTDNTNTSTGGASFASLLAIAFIVLKLCGVIDWPWIWVLAPLWVGLALVLTVLLFVGVVIAVVALVKKVRRAS